MEKVIHSLIKEDQTGFIKGRNASDNMRRLLHILDFADSHPTPCAVFSLDAEKAFDRLELELYVAFCNVSAKVNTSFLWLRHYTTHLQQSVHDWYIISPSFPLQAGNEAGVSAFPLIVLSISLTLSASHQEIWSID